ncbi:DUF2306 domain-containing protein [Nocardiopsis alborubida]|uniref:DUF2306 domain-containing protein n=1 Tax=Nocardiopsis alborubida TaxID=146802 RepID=A0A7X6RP12_9ACTN|nr:DUF2306 domain-containing protein [Nocardiopsis alborubida]NKY97254.1 DUF2306 domain-containing protein [Nocardiopsis alborubida]
MPPPSGTLSPPASSPAPRRRRRTAVLATVTTLCALVAVFAASAYVGLDPDASQVELRPDWPPHYPFLLVHVAASVIALTTAPLQLFPALRRGGAHRVIGRIHLFAGVFPGALSGLVVGVMSTYGFAAQAGFSLLAVLWFSIGVAGYRAIRQGRRADHREWMLRLFALTMAGVMLRVLVPVLVPALTPLLGPAHGGDEEAVFREVYQGIAWLCWVPNLLVAEWCLRRSRRGSASYRSA